MYRLTKSALVIALSLSLYPNAVLAENATIIGPFKKEVRKSCGFSTNVLAKKHTQKEWQSIYEAKQFTEELSLLCPKLKPVKANAVEEIYYFFYNYASDSGNTVLCN